MRILAEDYTRPQWLTTGDVARALDVTMNGVRWLVRTRQLACEWTRNGRRLFALREVRRLAEARLTKRLVGKGSVRPKMLWSGVGVRQGSLFGAPLRLISKGESGTSPR